MSIFITGMKMPKNCGDCWFEHAYEFCESKYEDCPLIELPPHGRLIDGDYVAETIAAMIAYHKSMDDAFWLVENAPTIIPAEEGE